MINRQVIGIGTLVGALSFIPLGLVSGESGFERIDGKYLLITFPFMTIFGILGAIVGKKWNNKWWGMLAFALIGSFLVLICALVSSVSGFYDCLFCM